MGTVAWRLARVPSGRGLERCLCVTLGECVVGSPEGPWSVCQGPGRGAALAHPAWFSVDREEASGSGHPLESAAGGGWLNGKQEQRIVGMAEPSTTPSYATRLPKVPELAAVALGDGYWLRRGGLRMLVGEGP